MTSKAVKISKDLYEELRKVAEQKGVQIKDVVEAALRLYLFNQGQVGQEEDIKNVKVIKNWRLMFPTKCAICNKEMQPGEWAVREILLLSDGRKLNRFYHYVCYQQLYDPKLTKLWLKQRELEIKVKVLEKEYKELLDEVLKLNILKEIHEINQEIVQAMRSLYDATEDKEKFQEVLDYLASLGDKLREKIETIEAFEKVRKRKKKVEVVAYEDV